MLPPASPHATCPLASLVPTMKSAEFSVVCLREYYGFLSGSGLW